MESLNEIGEFGFIKRISPGCLVRPEGVVKGIGDDAAAFHGPEGQLNLVTTDLLVERVHFLRREGEGFNLGYKALAVNLSDIAAMGGIAGQALVSLGIPENCSLEYLDDFYRGMLSLAEKFGVNILGGDTTGSSQDLIINLALWGTVPEQEILVRDGAGPGDMICSTGCLGDSRAGLYLLLGQIEADTPELKRLLEAHVRPRPCLEEGRFLASSRGVTSAIDVSDGLSSDLGHLVSRSGTGARIYARQIPVSLELRNFCARFNFDARQFALAGGEDYTLLFTVAANEIEALKRSYREKFGVGFDILGEMTDSGRMELVGVNGDVAPLFAIGWDHFRK